jgi:hypothetical protein
MMLSILALFALGAPLDTSLSHFTPATRLRPILTIGVEKHVSEISLMGSGTRAPGLVTTPAWYLLAWSSHLFSIIVSILVVTVHASLNMLA